MLVRRKEISWKNVGKVSEKSRETGELAAPARRVLATRPAREAAEKHLAECAVAEEESEAR
jgi:hypothetical protein